MKIAPAENWPKSLTEAELRSENASLRSAIKSLIERNEDRAKELHEQGAQCVTGAVRLECAEKEYIFRDFNRELKKIIGQT